jgi:hypothetical protein
MRRLRECEETMDENNPSVVLPDIDEQRVLSITFLARSQLEASK